jgi:5-(carboxyamino)imidazole ribonucleotide synthase
MLALAGIPLGMEFRLLDPSPDPPARFCGELITAAYDDSAALAAFAEGVDVVTFEFENVPLAAASWLAERLPVRPSPRSLELTQDRLLEKRLLRDLGIATAAFAAVDDRDSLEAALDDIGLPAVLKTRRMGYDGRGQAVLRDRPDADAGWSRLGGVPLLLEEFVDFERELSSIAVAGAGQTAVYPLVETRQRDGVLRSAIAPAPRVAAAVGERAEEAVIAVATELGHRGTLALEWFLAGSRLLANEIAPRVHNSGHWTIEGAATSQFENHLRAICGLPLGEVTTRPSACVNLLGSVPDIASVLALTGAHLHLYGKAERPGRKLGHVTVTAATETARDHRLAAVEALIGPGAA